MVDIRKRKYPAHDFLPGEVTQARYENWLNRKATTHYGRDKKRGNTSATRREYKEAIHSAVCRCQGHDEYTGEELRWSLILTYDNNKAKAQGRATKREFSHLPTIDHVGDGTGKPDFKICGWRVNDAKNDLTFDDFLELCTIVLRRAGYKVTRS